MGREVRMTVDVGNSTNQLFLFFSDETVLSFSVDGQEEMPTPFLIPAADTILGHGMSRDVPLQPIRMKFADRKFHSDRLQ